MAVAMASAASLSVSPTLTLARSRRGWACLPVPKTSNARKLVATRSQAQPPESGAGSGAKGGSGEFSLTLSRAPVGLQKVQWQPARLVLFEAQQHQPLEGVWSNSSSSTSAGEEGEAQPSSTAAAAPAGGLQRMNQDDAMGLVLFSAGCRQQGLGMVSQRQEEPVLAPWQLQRSPRRRLMVEFTCEKCGHRSQRLINPQAYATGTVFVQCAGCERFHKLIDNLKLYHEMTGDVYAPHEVQREPIDVVMFNLWPKENM
eukprot:jgi/Chlat1/4241/Chrsp27S04323